MAMQNQLAEFEVEQLPLVDADLLLWRQVDLGRSYDSLLQAIIDDSAWRQEEITLYGKPYLQPPGSSRIWTVNSARTSASLN